MTATPGDYAPLKEYLAHTSEQLFPPLSVSPEPDPAGEITTRATALPLRTSAEWESFHRASTDGRQGNLKPWFRCLSVLRALGARTVISETYYVCLDYRSEFASFYAHIDAPRRSTTTRLHFFAKDVGIDDIIDLSTEQSASYLGYIVCREGDLPLVGRTVIQRPAYIQESTHVVEPVNFFGQKLQVRGVPFMQQDQRFAVCSHVAAWVLHYSAFRRGIQERRHIADLVGIAGTIHPLRPRTSDGLTESQVSQMLNELGFRTAIHHTPTVENIFHTLPEVTPAELPKGLLSAFKAAGIDRLDQPDRGVIEQLETKFTDYLQHVDDSQDTIPAVDPSHPSVEAFHRLIDYLIRPYLRSGWPIYAGTSTHAFAICGRSEFDGRPVHFLHDDQNGPYLLAECLPAVSRTSLRHQSAYPGFENRGHAPERDVVEDILKGWPSKAEDARRAIEALVTAMPPRVLLSPSAANRTARATIRGARRGALLESLPDHERSVLLSSPNTEVSILMGIDYKVRRRAYALRKGDKIGVRVFSSLPLAEWVITVEAFDEEGACFAEFVYDASSSDDAPRMQFSRIFCAVAGVSPFDESHPESSLLDTSRFPALQIPERVGKVDAL